MFPVLLSVLCLVHLKQGKAAVLELGPTLPWTFGGQDVMSLQGCRLTFSRGRCSSSGSVLPPFPCGMQVVWGEADGADGVHPAQWGRLLSGQAFPRVPFRQGWEEAVDLALGSRGLREPSRSSPVP